MDSEHATGISKGYVILITTITSFMTAFMGSSMNVALPVIGKEFTLNAIFLSWIATAYFLTTATLLIPVGKLADIYGRTLFFKIGIGIFTLGSLLCAIAGSGVWLMIFRLFQGIGSSFIFTTSTAILVSAVPVHERGKVLGINVASVYIGLSSGPFLGGIIAHNFHWRYIFYSNTLLGVVLGILTLMKFTVDWREAKGEKFDIPGAVVLMVTMLFLMIGLTSLPGLYGFGLIILGGLGLYFFKQVEAKKETPVLNMQLFKNNRGFLFSNIAALINYAATFAIGFLMSLYLQDVRMLSAQEAGLVLISQPVMQALLSPLAGRLSDKIEPRIVASLGMGIITIGLIIFIFISPAFPFPLIIGNLALLGTGFALFSSPNANAVMSSIEKKHYGPASAILTLMRMSGQMFSLGVVIVLINVFIGKAQISVQNQATFIIALNFAFSFFSLICLLGVFASLSRGKIIEHRK